MSTTITSSASSESLYQVKLLSALRTGDPALIHPFLSEIEKHRTIYLGESQTDLGAAALHLAIRCASIETVSLLLSHRSIPPNAVHPPASGTTPLHLAASLGRADVVNLLLEQDGIDDTLRDINGRTCTDVARGKDVLSVINDSRSLLTASYRSLLRSYTLSPPNDPPSPVLLALLSSPRSRLVDLSYLDDTSGSTLLHEATRRRDLRLVDLAVRAGADVFIRDRKGRPVQEVVGKDDRMRVFLRQFANNDTTLINDGPITGPPTLKGYLNKYTNVARGYSTRWFVLKDGVLSYYRHQEDEQVASRGSIVMKTAVLRSPAGAEKLRFEIHSTPSRGHTSVQKWYMKANHPVEASRWTQAISRAIEHAKQMYRPNEGDTSSISRHSGRGSVSSTLSVPHSQRKDRDAESVSSSLVPTDDEGGDILTHGDPSPPERDNAEQHDASSGNDSTDRIYGTDNPPHESSFELHGNSMAAQLELTIQLLADLSPPSTTVTRSVELNAALKEALGNLQGILNEYLYMAKERDDWWRAQLNRERERQTVWEQSLHSVVKEGEALERELRRHSRKHTRIDSSTSGGEGTGTIKARPSALPLSPPIEEGEVELQEPTPATAVPIPSASGQRFHSPESTSVSVSPGAALSRALSAKPSVVHRMSIQRPSSVAVTGLTRSNDEDDVVDTDDEDEFFDAIESNALPNLVVHDALTGHSEPLLPKHIDRGQYDGYRVLRRKLDLKNDNRPPTSLWAVLKHSIGKDLTKISFPVFFNEPTSMLQRMAEDMEFSECLDAAFGERDPLRRIAFVAAFAMSNYSSTIGRIAKPFNPMLSETFEYVRLDKEYRYVSEQVSHHPPISACWAEGSRQNDYQYFIMQVDAQNKFTGKSFEIRPTGVANVDILLPAEWGPTYPKLKNKYMDSERAVEHYSWKKVTTNVSGFILGSSTIDHYGDMIITNHRTKDHCLLTFKPRGWRGKDAFEISGYVADAAGNVAYEIAGRWNSQLIMRPVGTGSGLLNPDQTVRGPNSPSPTPEFILLWRNSEKPLAPFNLTPFAISLNNLPEDTLRPYLPLTDCRLRPDQRAFELGRYEHANTLKTRQEEYQRAIRKAREEGRLPPHRPRWFSAETDGDTGERVWAPVRIGEEVAYWVERERAYEGGGKDAWTDVDRIFIDDDDNPKDREVVVRTDGV
ncbi:Oxysterol-binding protein-domain-containing protein [Multifurca ochricompacta]|uniref:Oxysterol-binding protein-domain-containing protein n=1 Tax=Multifurca ochricompacta TaxID=376703 RepID=A0AAD4MAZ3_9AGAM|nr:Oxysterol-binding protein-domain-containing protein [Multifurca ochricompacta]